MGTGKYNAGGNPVTHLISFLSSGEWKYTLSLHSLETEISASMMGHITRRMYTLPYLVAGVQGTN